ncbi:MAG: toll/interleukin-1 receptor domain-containing protein [Ilumatobacteraceae bacterium]
MRLFVSYSRHDAATVHQIVTALEAAGHDVWIDTDDIRGSERWRTSVATAIRASDVVLLVVSPSAMASSNVEREISVAAEDSLRIVPVVIEAAPISVGLKYDLAGVQHVSFVDRPFEDGMADLEAALIEPLTATPSATDPASPPVVERGTPTPSASRRRRPSRTALYGAAVVVVLVAAILVARQFGSDRDGAGTDVSAESPAVTATDSTDSPVTGAEAAPSGAPSSAATFDTTVWFAGFAIRVTRAEYDEATGELAIDVVFTNDQPAAADPLALLVGSTPLVVDGTRFLLDCTNCTRLPPSTSTRAVLDATVPGGVDLAEATIEFGTPDQHQAIVPLDGSPATWESPKVAPIDGTLVDGGMTFTAETVEILPAGCSGLASNLAYAPGRADEMSIVVTGSAVTDERYGTGLGDALLTPPDGVTLASNSLSGVIFALAPGVPQPDVRACFSVPAPVAGDYRFTVARSGADAFPEPIIISL